MKNLRAFQEAIAAGDPDSAAVAARMTLDLHKLTVAFAEDGVHGGTVRGKARDRCSCEVCPFADWLADFERQAEVA